MSENRWYLAFWTWLISLRMMLFSFIHFHTNKIILLFCMSLWLNNIPWYIHTYMICIFDTYKCVYIYTHIYLYNIFFIHSSVVWYLNYFCILVIVKRASMNIDMKVSFCILIYTPSDICPKVVWHVIR
jgi:hypothetical protein